MLRPAHGRLAHAAQYDSHFWDGKLRSEEHRRDTFAFFKGTIHNKVRAASSVAVEANATHKVNAAGCGGTPSRRESSDGPGLACHGFHG